MWQAGKGWSSLSTLIPIWIRSKGQSRSKASFHERGAEKVERESLISFSVLFSGTDSSLYLGVRNSGVEFCKRKVIKF
jgi:hypothetical protein